MNLFIESVPIFVAISSAIITLWFLFYDRAYEKKISVKGVLTNQETMKGILRLINYAKQENPDYIVGLNRGGTLVGALITLYLDLTIDRFIRCSIPNEHDIDCHVHKLTGKILIVDSVIRTGTTFNNIVLFIKKNAPHVKDIKCATIISCQNEEEKHFFDQINYCSYTTKDKKIMLPWTKEKDFLVAGRLSSLHKEFKTSKDENIEGLVCQLFSSFNKNLTRT